MHHRQVRDDECGMGYIATTLDEQQELLELTKLCAQGWAGALEDFADIVKENSPLINLKDKNNYKKWQCLICDFIYDEYLGLPEEGILPGTFFEDIPDD